MKTISRIAFFLSIVWRPVTGDAGDTWLQSWRKYRLDAVTAWKIANLTVPTQPPPRLSHE